MSYYELHLYYEKQKFSKEYQVQKLYSILGLIARCKDAIDNFSSNSEHLSPFYNLIERQKQKAEMYNKILVRLKTYYNNELNKLTKF